MKVYSDVLTYASMRYLSGDGLYYDTLESLTRPRLRRYGYRVLAYGHSNRWKNSGNRGAGNEHAATWDDHGRWMARVFREDPKALIVACGRYDGAEDFHTKTKERYKVPDLPCVCAERRDDDDRPMQSDTATCGACHFSWCDRCHPTPSARCHNEENHGER